MKKETQAKLNVALAMAIFGTIGIFRRFIPLGSEVIADLRGLIGILFLVGFYGATRRKPDLSAMRPNLPLLLIGGISLGFNWIVLFEAYNYTTLAVATLCYNMAPVILILVSPLFFREKLTGKKAICALIAVFGIVLVSGVLEPGGTGGSTLGVVLGLLSALLYAATIIINKKISGITGLDRTLAELTVSTVVLAVYILIVKGPSEFAAAAALARGGRTELLGFILLLLVGVIHTGIAYTLYFGSMGDIPAQTIALVSYMDPVVAILLSALVLQEHIGVFGLIGACLVLGATAVSELTGKKPDT